jgi:class 3 adenylate cyclase/tetratricopeptide (TPR) repeat protein
MHRVVPELIIENYRKGCYGGQFEAVGFFLDLSGFSTMTDTLMQQGQHGAEVLAGLMHGVFDPLVESIFAYRGKIVSFAGDGIMALFPIESDERSTALSALAASWEIQHRLTENPWRQTIYGKFPFSAKIGLAVGTVVWGILRSEDEQNATYYFRGTPVDESAEAEHHATAGEIIITNGMKELLQDSIQTQPFGPFHRFGSFSIELPTAIPAAFHPIDVETARLFMPEKIIVQDVRSEFRQIVNLFMRFPDLPNEKLEAFFHTVFALRKKYGGLLNRLDFGDKGCNLLMLWGAPVAYENDIGRALNFILDLQSSVDFPITAGITYYIAHAGYLGSTMCEDYTCYGWGINLASRFMMSASQGQVWVDDRIARRVSSRFDVEFVGAQRFKGFSAEQSVNLLKGQKREAELIYQSELIGRENDLALLENFAEPLWNGNFAGMLLVVGEAGMGKGRLVHEFRVSELFEDNKALWALCQSDQILRQSFNPLRSWLFHYFGFTSTSNLDDRKHFFESRLQELIAATPDGPLVQELDRLRSVLGALVDLRWADSLYEQLDAEGRYNNTLLALIAFIKAESLRQPLILFIEDMQFIDGDTLRFLPRLRRSILTGEDNYPIAIIATSRPYGSKPPPDDLVDKFINLRGLALEEVARLTEILLGGVPAVELVKLVTERSEGNPYFVEQIIRYLQDENLIEISPVGWNKVKRTRDFFLPGDIRALLVARLDQLADEVKDVVHTASVLGREVALSVLAEMMGGAENIQRIVADAQQSEIWISHGEDHFLFTHGLLRDAAYTMQMRARRQELHRLAVQALEKIYANELNFHYAEVAYHAERAELLQKTQHYYTLAGKSAADMYQNSQAIDYFTRALAFTNVDDHQIRFDLLTERIALFHRAGDRLSQAEDLDSLKKLAEKLDDDQWMGKVLMLRASYHFATSDYLNSIDYAKQAEMYSSSIVNTELALYTQVVWATALLRLGELDEAMQRSQETLIRDQAAGNRKEECRILNVMGLIALEQKEPAHAHKYFVEALEIARELKDPGLEVRALNNLALSEGSVNGNYVLAQEYYEQSHNITREIGDRTAEGFTLVNLGFVAGMQGDFVAARSYHEQSLYLAREIGNRYHEMLTLVNLSSVAGMQNEAIVALEFAHQAAELARKISERAGEAWAMLYMGHAYLLQNELQMAQTAYRKSAEIRDELGQPALSMEPIAGLVETYLRANDLESASREAEKILKFLESGSSLDGTEEPLRIYFACYQLLEKKQDPRSKQILHTAAKLLVAQASRFSDDVARRRYVENIPWRRAIQGAAQIYLH